MSDQIKQLTDHLHDQNKIILTMSPGETVERKIAVTQIENTLKELQDNIKNLKDAFNG